MSDTASGDEDGLPMVEDYYRLIAWFLFELSYERGPEPLLKFFQDNFEAQFKKMKPLILEDSLFDDIISTLGDNQPSKVISAILEQDMAKFWKEKA